MTRFDPPSSDRILGESLVYLARDVANATGQTLLQSPLAGRLFDLLRSYVPLEIDDAFGAVISLQSHSQDEVPMVRVCIDDEEALSMDLAGARQLYDYLGAWIRTTEVVPGTRETVALGTAASIKVADPGPPPAGDFATAEDLE